MAGTAGNFQIKPWEVRGEGREFESISNDFARAALALEQKLGGVGTPWGHDGPGTQFDTVYLPARQDILAGLNALADQLGGIGTGLNTMADNASQTDDEVKAGFTKVELPSGGPRPV